MKNASIIPIEFERYTLLHTIVPVMSFLANEPVVIPPVIRVVFLCLSLKC